MPSVTEWGCAVVVAEIDANKLEDVRKSIYLQPKLWVDVFIKAYYVNYILNAWKISNNINNYKHLDNFNDYLYFLILLPCISFLHINQAKLIGFKLPIKSQISEKLIFPIIFLVSISYLLHSEGLMLTVQIVLLCHTFSLITAMLAVEYFLTKLLKNKYINNKKMF